jgi:hypothetical protein
MGASIWARRLIMPIGRHTLMHTWVPADPHASSAPIDEPDEILTTIRAIVNRWEVLDQWYQETVGRNLAALGMEGDVPLHDYVRAIGRGSGKVNPGKRECFKGLCARFQLIERGREDWPDGIDDA